MAENEFSLTSRHRATLSCLECHKRKKKCDRKSPCNQCTKARTKRKCQYQLHEVPSCDSQEHFILPAVQLHSRRDVASNAMQSLGMNTDTERELNDSSQVTGPQFSDLDSMALISGKPPSHEISGASMVTSMTPRDGLLMNNFLVLFKGRLDLFAESDFTYLPHSPADWLSRATKHPATFYSLLYCGATIYADNVKKMYQEICPKSGCLPYKIAAIRNINENLAKSSTAVTDEMILAVLTLMNFDSAMETLAEYKVHMDGLQQMIDLRGGLDLLGYDGILKNWYQWCNNRMRLESARGSVNFKAISVLPGDITV